VKITQVSTWRTQCGIAGYTELLCRGLAEHGVESDVVAIDREATRDLSVRELREHFEQLGEQLRDAELIHIQHEFGFFAGSYHFRASIMNFRRVLRAARRGGRPVFVTFHSLPFDVSWAHMDWSRLPAEQLVMLAARNAWRAAVVPLVGDARGPRAIVHGRLGRRLLIDSGVRREHIAVIPHGTPPPRPAGSTARRAEVRARLGLAEDATVLGIFGYLSAAKGHVTAVEALEHLPEHYQLVLAGGPHPLDERSALRAVLARVADRPELRDRVAVTGYLPEADAIDCLDAVDIMLAPYEDRQQVSSGALGWALASGKPVIATRVPMFREIVEQSGCAELVALDSPGELALAAERIAEEPALRERLLSRARDWCEENSWTQVASRHAALYARALGRERPRVHATRGGEAASNGAGGTRARLGRAGAPAPLRRAGAHVAPGFSLPVRLNETGASVVLRPASLPDGREFAFALDPRRRGDPIARNLLEHGYVPDLLCELALHLLRDGGTLVDIGAHLGSFTLSAAAQGCRVLAIEASSSNVRLLRTAVAYSGFAHVHVLHAAAAARAGAVEFIEEGPFGAVADRSPRADEPARAVQVPAVRVDEQLAAHGLERVDLVKIDVEGYEIEVLEGLGELLDAPQAPTVLFESNAYALGRARRTVSELRSYLAERGYRLYLVDRECPGELVACAADELQIPAAVDCLALKREPTDLAPWRIRDPLDHREQVARLRRAAGGDANERRYAAAAYQAAGSMLRDDPLLRDMIVTLRRDRDARVTAVAQGRESLRDYGLAELGGARNGRTRRQQDERRSAGTMSGARPAR
jgi:FkbM family methyltransferase